MQRLEVDKWGNKFWYDENDLSHREDGPAIEFANGNKHWYVHGKRHRDDGPASEISSGCEYWYKDDQLHREDGPAIKYINGNSYWFYRGEPINCSSNEEFLRLIKLKIFW